MILENTSQVSCGVTDIGLSRTSNQDQFLTARLRHPVEMTGASLSLGEGEGNADGGMLLAVADGMGGHSRGELASAIALRSIVEHVSLHWQDFLSSVEGGHSRVVERLKEAFADAHQSMRDLAREDRGLCGMGTTLTVAYSRGSRLVVAHAGDSRCYRMHDSRIEQITTDQTVANLMDEGEHNPESGWELMYRNRMSHVLYNCVGGNSDAVEVECHEWELQPADSVLLCSDGLTRHVSDDRIAEIVVGVTAPDVACRRLVQAANQAGGTDNITVVIARRATTHGEACPGVGKESHSSALLPTCDSSADTAPYFPPRSCCSTETPRR